MRPIIAAAIWLVLVGGLTAYMSTRQEVIAPRTFDLPKGKGEFSMEITASFDAEPDPFSLRADKDDPATTLLVKLNGRQVLQRTDKVPGGTPLVAENIAGVIQGKNEVYLEVNPGVTDIYKPHAVRVRVLRDNEPIAERTFWSEPGTRIAGTLSFDVKMEQPTEEKDHGH